MYRKVRDKGKRSKKQIIIKIISLFYFISLLLQIADKVIAFVFILFIFFVRMRIAIIV